MSEVRPLVEAEMGVTQEQILRALEGGWVPLRDARDLLEDVPEGYELCEVDFEVTADGLVVQIQADTDCGAVGISLWPHRAHLELYTQGLPPLTCDLTDPTADEVWAAVAQMVATEARGGE